VGQHRLADDVTNGKDVWNVGPHLPVNRDESALIDRNAGVLGSDELAVRSATDCDKDPVEDIGGRSTAALKMHGKPLPVRFDFRDLALRWMASYCFAMRFISGVTMSLSAPGMIWSMSSTTVTWHREHDTLLPSPGR
jgi:hypothetical protein